MKNYMKKQSKNKKILYLYTGNHPVHRKFAESVNADIQKLSWNVPKGYNIYISEGDYKVLPLLKRKRKISGKIINLFSDPRLFYLDKGLEFRNNKIKKMNYFKKIISKKLIRCFDGFIAVGNFETQLLKKISPKKPILNIPAFISEDNVKKLSNLKPSLKGKKILFIGNGPDYFYKGIDILIDVFKDLKKKDLEYKLDIIGEWKLKKEWLVEGISFKGLQKDIFKFIEKSDLYLHLARGEAYGVTILESMISSLPVIIARDIGAREIVKKIDKNLIVPYKKEIILKRIEEYFNKSNKNKKEIGLKLKKEAVKLEEKIVLNSFRKKWRLFEKEIYGKKQI